MTKIKYLFAGLVVAAVVAAPVAANATASQGHGHTPVTVCHNGSTLTVDDNALKAHLAHGDTEGPCQESTVTPAPTQQTSPTQAPSNPLPTPTNSPPTSPTSTPATPQPESPAEPSQPTESAASTPSSGATSPGSTPTTSPEIQYVTALFEIQGGDWKNPQKYITSRPVADLHAFDNIVECGKEYQVDIYRPLADGTPPSVLWQGGYLLYAHDGPFLAYELDYTPYKQFTTPPCPTTPTEPEEEPSSPSTPVIPAGPTPTTAAPSTPTAESPLTAPTAEASPTTAPAATGTTTAPATVSNDTNSSGRVLAMTGSEAVMQWVTIGALLLFVGAFAVWDARKMRKFKIKK